MRWVAAVILFLSPGTLARADDVPTAAPKSVTADGPGVTLRRSACPCGNCWVARTSNFRIEWCTSAANLRQLAERCERLAARAKTRWLSDTHSPPWTPQCDVVVHRRQSDYVACLGPGSEQTSGCATIRLDQGRVVVRRIDLQSEAPDWETESLPHELMHVVLADRFSRQRIPPWANEGIAMLCESPQLLKRRLGELRRVASQGTIYSLGDLINVRSRPQPAFRDAFNGQSIALVSSLLECGTPGQCLEFVEASREKDWKAAFREVYGDQSNDLERSLSHSIWTERAVRWARDATVPATPPAQLAAHNSSSLTH
jgi:hypothetical protein